MLQKYLIIITLGLSVVIHIIILLVLPSITFSKSYGYTSRDISFLINQFSPSDKDIKINEKESLPPQKENVTPVNKEGNPSLKTSESLKSTDKEIEIPPLSINKESKTEKEPEQTSRESTLDEAKERMRLLEEYYKKNNITPEKRISQLERNKSYITKVREQIQAKYFIPEEAKRQKLTGKVTIKMKVSSKGEILNSEVFKHSDYPILDMAALSAVQSAAPFPNIADQIDRKYLVIIIPFIYQ